MPSVLPLATPVPVVLASTSPWRRSMLATAGIAADAADPGVDESEIDHADPRQLALFRAQAKAAALPSHGRIVIGADQVCHLDGVVYGKPSSDEDHCRQLRALRGRTHTLSDGVAICFPGGSHAWVTDVGVTLRADLSDEEIEAYVRTGDGRGCAGGYRVDGLGAQLIERIDGDWFAVVGLPLLDVVGVLRSLGWRPFDDRHKSAPSPQRSHA